MNTSHDQLLLNDAINVLIINDATIDATNGGLVIGPLHKDGGVKMYQIDFDGNYKYAGEMEGGEYIINESASELYMERLHTLNNEKDTGQTFITHPPKDVTILNCLFEDMSSGPRILIFRNKKPQFVVNKYATKKHLNLLEELNNNITK